MKIHRFGRFCFGAAEVLRLGRSAALAIFATTCCLSAQESKPEPIQQPGALPAAGQAGYTLRLSARLVTLDVVVTDKRHNLHLDLRKEDFHITEDGQPQTILNFEPPSAHALPESQPPIESTADLEKRSPNAPVDILVIDEMNTSFTDTEYARYTLKKYLEEQPERLVAPTMLIALSFDHFSVLKDYTQDRQAIKTAIDKHQTTYPFAQERGESVILFLGKSIGALSQVARATAGHPGRKNVVWVGKGFHGIDLGNPNLDQNAVHSLETGIQQCVNLLRDSRITLYTIDPTALSSTVAYTTDDASPLGSIGDSQSPFDGDINFASLAKATSGRSFWSRNDVDSEIGESIRDGVNFYTITYRPTEDLDLAKPYRKIRIGFDLPDLRAGYRDGYYIRDEAQPNNKGRALYDVAAAEESTMVYTGLTVKAIAKPGAPGTYIVGVPEKELAWKLDGESQSAVLKLVAVSLDRKSKMLKRATKELTERRRIPIDSAPEPSGLIRLEISLPDTPGQVRIRFVLDSNADGKLGTADLTGDEITKPPSP